MKKNYLIVILFFIVVWILLMKININKKNNRTDNLSTKTTINVEQKKKIDNLSLPTPTIINITTFGNKTKEEILAMEPEESYDFITGLSRKENEELDMMPNYDFSQFLPYRTENFIVERFDYQNKKLTVKPLIENKTKIKEQVDNWLFYKNGNNPKKIEIIWSE